MNWEKEFAAEISKLENAAIGDNGLVRYPSLAGGLYASLYVAYMKIGGLQDKLKEKEE